MLIETVTAQIRACEADLQTVAASDAVVGLLRTVPGVGVITALTYRAVLDDVGALCRRARSVAAYLGLVPREDSTGDRGTQGPHHAEPGSSELRVLFVQASWVIWRQRGGARLQAWVQRVAARRGKRIAVVALARRLSRILYAMWRDGRDLIAAAPQPA